MAHTKLSYDSKGHLIETLYPDLWDCLDCSGSGQRILDDEELEENDLFNYEKKCPNCKGSGINFEKLKGLPE